MSINKKIIFAALIGIVFGVSSCKKFLNVNTNPNSAPAATCPTLLTGGELLVGTAVGVDLEIDGSFFAEYWTQSPGASQYQALNKYAPGQDQFSTPWTNLYAAAENFYQLEKLADSQKKSQYKAIALLMQAYTFQLITDGWGDAPFSQALKGQYADGHVVNPKYDSQDSIYMGIIALIDSANAILNPAASVNVPANDDLIYQGNLGYWQEFSNTLALRVYMRLSQINPTLAQAGIDSLYAHPTTSVFIGSASGDDAKIPYGFNSANNNPLYAEEAGLQYYQNYVACNTILDTMLHDQDPRHTLFFEPVPYNPPGWIYSDSFVSLPDGLYNGVAYTGYSIASLFMGADAANAGTSIAGNPAPIPYAGSYTSGNAPVNLLTSYESLFLQAEAAARGWGTQVGMDPVYFQEAIAANFNYYNGQLLACTGFSGAYQDSTYMAMASYWTQYPTGGTPQQKIQFIITQKWFAMCGNQGFEAWTEWRRTGYPSWFTYSVSSIIGNTFPKRFTYPTSESVVNGSFPGLVPLTTKVWWDAPSSTDH